MEPIFQDPPPSTTEQEWTPTVEKLIARTGVWALICDKPYLGPDSQEIERLIGRIRASRGEWAGHSWEAMQRTMGRTRTLEQRREARIHVYAKHLAAQDDGEAS